MLGMYQYVWLPISLPVGNQNTSEGKLTCHVISSGGLNFVFGLEFYKPAGFVYLHFGFGHYCSVRNARQMKISY